MKVADFSEGEHVPQGKNSRIAVNLDESRKTTGFSKVSGVNHDKPSFESCRAAPVGLTGIRLKFQMESNADIATLDKLVSLTERYCVIYQTLIKGIPIATQRVSN